jgi:hypothetical protein
LTLRPTPEAYIRTFALAKSHFIPENEEDTRGIAYKLGEDEPFESEFFGASLEHCGEYAIALLDPECSGGLRLEQGMIIVIADERSARDDTVLLRFHVYHPGIEFEDWGFLPREAREHNAWVDFRVDYRKVDVAVTSIEYVSPGVSYPAYYGHKQDFTDENGVFNTDKAEEHILTIADERDCKVYRTNRSGRDRSAMPNPPDPHM